METLEDLLTVKDVALIKGVSKSAVSLAVATGALKAVRTKYPRLFRLADVNAWMPYTAMMRRAAQARKEKSGANPSGSD